MKTTDDLKKGISWKHYKNFKPSRVTRRENA